MLILYDILYILFTICYLPILIVRGKLHRGFLMRLGIFPQEIFKKIAGKKVIWLHTVSVGEAGAASELVKYLKEDYPEHRLVISTVTKSGNRIAQGLIGLQDAVIYSPLDIGFIVRRVINSIKPQAFIVAETEIWPNLTVGLARAKVPIILVNGRISSGSFRGYQIIRPFLRGVLRKFNLFCMQTTGDAQRIIELGAQKDKVKVTGNMKFDIGSSDAGHSLELGLKENEQLFIAGSTHRGEEKIVLEVYKELIKSHPNLRLLIAPRHIERTKEIETLISKLGFYSQRISRLEKGLRTVFILDTIGQLKNLYSLADIVFVGGSLIAHGGQNPIEPAVFGKAIIFGPHMFNFSDLAGAFRDKDAVIMVKNAKELRGAALQILNDDRLRENLGKKAKELIRENTGASFRNAQLIKNLIN